MMIYYVRPNKGRDGGKFRPRALRDLVKQKNEEQLVLLID